MGRLFTPALHEKYTPGLNGINHPREYVNIQAGIRGFPLDIKILMWTKVFEEYM